MNGGFIVDNHLAGFIQVSCCKFGYELDTLFAAIDSDCGKEDSTPALEENSFNIILKERRVFFELMTMVRGSWLCVSLLADLKSEQKDLVVQVVYLRVLSFFSTE